VKTCLFQVVNKKSQKHEIHVHFCKIADFVTIDFKEWGIPIHVGVYRKNILFSTLVGGDSLDPSLKGSTKINLVDTVSICSCDDEADKGSTKQSQLWDFLLRTVRSNGKIREEINVMSACCDTSYACFYCACCWTRIWMGKNKIMEKYIYKTMYKILFTVRWC